MVDHLFKLFEGDDDLLLLAIHTIGDLVVFDLFVTDDEGEWDLLDD